jgi:predicted RNA-binding Zn-ribbon protein involved in translation (DUF1610 family)
MDLTIEQNCPSCGAPLIVVEDDRLVQCPYCDVGNYRLDGGAGRYLLSARPPARIRATDLFFVPYLRFKGSIYYVGAGEVGHKIVDTTRIGIEETAMPVSLGLRPQAMQLMPMVAGVPGAFVRQTVPTKTAFAHAAMVTELFSGKSDRPIYHRAFIGETLSRIYQPCYIDAGMVHDAVDNRIVGPGTILDKHRAGTDSSKIAWEPRFISTICPECGGLLTGERDSLVLRCQNCQTLWREHSKKFHPQSWLVVPSEESAACYLPFWRLTFSTKGWVLKSFGDYLRFTNQPVVVGARYDVTPLSFWMPAFKLNPKSFLQIAAQLTISQGKIPAGDKRRVDSDHPVTLSGEEAGQAIKSVLAATTLNKGTRLPLLKEMTIIDTRCDLLYLPFVRQSHDYVQEHTFAAIPAAAIRFGRTL